MLSSGFDRHQDDQLTDSHGYPGTAPAGPGIQSFLFANPVMESRAVDDRGDLPDCRTEFPAQIQQPAPLVRLQEDPLAWNTFPQQLVLGLDDLYLFLEVVTGRSGQKKQERMVPHQGGKIGLSAEENGRLATFLYPYIACREWPWATVSGSGRRPFGGLSRFAKLSGIDGDETRHTYSSC